MPKQFAQKYQDTFLKLLYLDTNLHIMHVTEFNMYDIPNTTSLLYLTFQIHCITSRRIKISLRTCDFSEVIFWGYLWCLYIGLTGPRYGF